MSVAHKSATIQRYLQFLQYLSASLLHFIDWCYYQRAGRYADQQNNLLGIKMDLCNNHCIVTFMDLIDVKKTINSDSRLAVEEMQKFHQLVYGQINNCMPNHQHAYTWNDSVLLVAQVDGSLSQCDLIMREADDLKKKIDQICKSYAISVKGMSFQEPLPWGGHQFEGQMDQPKFVFLKSSSYAFSNCFEIEKKLKKHKKSWYLDERIHKKITTQQSTITEQISMLPSGTKRDIFMYENYLW